MTQYVYDFAQGDKDQKALLGGKGADYVSCSPFRVPVARLEAERAAAADDPDIAP